MRGPCCKKALHHLLATFKKLASRHVSSRQAWTLCFVLQEGMEKVGGLAFCRESGLPPYTAINPKLRILLSAVGAWEAPNILGKSRPPSTAAGANNHRPLGQVSYMPSSQLRVHVVKCTTKQNTNACQGLGQLNRLLPHLANLEMGGETWTELWKPNSVRVGSPLPEPASGWHFTSSLYWYPKQGSHPQLWRLVPRVARVHPLPALAEPGLNKLRESQLKNTGILVSARPKLACLVRGNRPGLTGRPNRSEVFGPSNRG